MCVSEEFIRLLFGDLLDVSGVRSRNRAPTIIASIGKRAGSANPATPRTSAGSAPCMNIVSLTATRADPAIPETLAV